MSAFSPFNEIDAFGMHLGAAIDPHSVPELTVAFDHYCAQNFQSPFTFTFFTTLPHARDLLSALSCNIANLRGWTPRWTPKPKFMYTKVAPNGYVIDSKKNGGERGIRTPGALSGTDAFEASGFNHSPISPGDCESLKLF